MEKKRKSILKTIWCIILSIAMAAGNSSMAFAHSEGNVKKISSKKQSDKKKEGAKQHFPGSSYDGEPGQMIGNEYLEFMVDSFGLFTIGNVEGNPDYESDNNQILMYGHSEPGTSFSTIRILSSRNEICDFMFETENTVYDTVGKTATSTMHATGSFESGEAYDFVIVQLLEFVKGSGSREDTVKISYKITNNGLQAQKAGIRIMLDTMLADNDDAPFKVMGYGNVTSELELRGSNVPSAYQVYDDLDHPTTLATGTLYLPDDRIPDKVQFAMWRFIEETYYDYTIENWEFGDTAVGIYFDPIVLEASASTSVCTYYGVNNNLTLEEDDVTVENLGGSQFAVYAYDSISKRYLSGAEVTVAGSTVVTDENGAAVFQDLQAIDGSVVSVTVKKDGYVQGEAQRQVLCGSFTGIGMVPQGYGQDEPVILGAVLQCRNSLRRNSSGDIYDLLTTYVYYDEAKENEKPDASVEIQVTNAGKADTYRLVQAGVVKYESTDGKFRIPIATKDEHGITYAKPHIVGLSAGQRVELQVIKSGWGIKYANLGLQIGNPALGVQGVGQGTISLGDHLKFTIPGNVPVLGGQEVEFGTTDSLPLSAAIEDSGKVRVAIGKDFNENAGKAEWDAFMESYYKMQEQADSKNVSKLHDYMKDKADKYLITQSYGAGPFKFECNMIGYGEGAADSSGKVNVEVGIILELKGQNGSEYYFGESFVPVYIGGQGEIATQIHGNVIGNGNNFSFVGGDCEVSPSFQLNIEGGAGTKGAIDVSGEGNVNLNWQHRFSDSYDLVKMSGPASWKAKLLLFEAEIPFLESEYTVWDDKAQVSNARALNRAGFTFALSERASGGSGLDLEPLYTGVQEVLVQGERYRFYLADDTFRNSWNRTTIVYQKYGSQGWTQPIQLYDDGTADCGFAVAVQGSDIYVAWENMAGKLDENASLDDMLQSCQISLCRLDTATGNTEMLYQSKDTANDKAQGHFSPAVSVASDSTNNTVIKVAWYGNTQNYMYGLQKADEGKDYIYHTTITSGSSIVIPSQPAQIETEGHVMSLALGVLDNKDAIVYAVDADGDFSTEDIALYAYWDRDSVPLQENTNPVRTNAKFAQLGNVQTMFYYCSGNIAYTATGKDADIYYVFDKEDLPVGLSDSFSVLSGQDGNVKCILWKSSDGQDGQDIYAVNYSGAAWSKPVVVKNIKGKDVSIPTGYVSDDGTIVMSYGYNNNGKAVVVSEEVRKNIDTSLDYIYFEQEDVKPGADLGFDIHVFNKGLTEIDKWNIIVSQNGAEIAKKTVDAKAGVGQDAYMNIPAAFTVPDTLAAPAEFQVEVYADGETDKADNVQTITVGCTDIVVEANGRFMERGKEYIALKVENRSVIPAEEVRLKILADSSLGTVVYDKYIQKLAAGETKYYNVNISSLEDSRIAYARISTDTADYHLYNNIVLLPINPYYNRTVVPEAQKVEKITLSLDNASLTTGKTLQLRAEVYPADAENQVLRWKSSNEAVATVDANGLVTAVGGGEATITAESTDGSNISASCIVVIAGQNPAPDPDPGTTPGGSTTDPGTTPGGSTTNPGTTPGGSTTNPGTTPDEGPVIEKLYYIIQFDANSGTKLSRKTMTLLMGDSLGIMPKVQRADYAWKGWYTQKTGGEKIGSTSVLNMSTTLYAQWDKIAKPEKPKKLSVSSKKNGQVTVSFQKAAKAEGYQIEYATNKKFSSSAKKNTASAKKTIAKLKSGKKYYIRVRAYVTDSTGKKIYGAYSTAKSIKVK